MSVVIDSSPKAAEAGNTSHVRPEISGTAVLSEYS